MEKDSVERNRRVNYAYGCDRYNLLVMDLKERYDGIKSGKRKCREMFRDCCGNLVIVYGGYGLGWEVQRICGNRTLSFFFNKRVEANKLISTLRRK